MVTVLCASPDVPDGHLVVTDDGGYLHSDVLVVELQEFAGRPSSGQTARHPSSYRRTAAGGGCEDGFSSVFLRLNQNNYLPCICAQVTVLTSNTRGLELRSYL